MLVDRLCMLSCHSERSEGSLSTGLEILRCAQHDSTVLLSTTSMPPYGCVVLVAAMMIAAMAKAQRKTSKISTAIGIRTTPAALPPLRR